MLLFPPLLVLLRPFLLLVPIAVLMPNASLAPAAFCAGLVDAAEAFLPTDGRAGFFPQLAEAFGPHAFGYQRRRLSSWLATIGLAGDHSKQMVDKILVRITLG